MTSESGDKTIDFFEHVFTHKLCVCLYYIFSRFIKPTNNNIVNFFVVGEGFHNYHHTFPWDYRSSETISKINYTTFFIEICQKLGLAYDLKYPSMDMIKRTVLKKGDGTHSMMSEVSSPKWN